MKWEGDVSGPLPPFLEYLEGVRAGDLPSLMLVCPPCLPYPHFLLFHCHLFICLWTTLGAILSICVFFATWAFSLHPGFDPFASWGISLCTSPNWHSVPFSCPYVSLWVTSVFISGPGLPSWSDSSPHPCLSLPVISGAGLWPSLPAFISVLGPCHSVSLPNHLGPLPAHLSSSAPSSPLSPSPSAVSPTGSACCSRCSCTAAWGQWPGAMSPR